MRVLVTGGGTGGHIYPALALIDTLKKQNQLTECLYIGSKNGLEAEIVERAELPFRALTISGFKRKLSFHNVRTVYRFLRATKTAKRYIKEFQPDIVIGTGGYVCGPVVYAAAKMNVPTVIHEQNSVPGLTNKFLSKYADRVAVTFTDSAPFFPEDKVVETGNPRAQQMYETAKSLLQQPRTPLYGLDPTKKTVLIFGGSRGASPVNRAVIESLSKWEDTSYQCIYVTGEVHHEEIQKEMDKRGSVSNISIQPFIHDMPNVLAKVDLVVARAGATTLAELTALGLPSVLIPSPYVTNNHQEKNARSLADRGAAVVLKEEDLSGESLFKEIETILSDEKYKQSMTDASKSIGQRDAGDRLTNVMNDLITEKKS
ncbi:undecaprenyldiphospho-muramoylpentapeptide beta-N-acetylglucosaminyltransferase [Texcoconibacillus texcoconensis]|uniref:UDP-N-acetylglucosamine--N-acetylmuramyl-(pentapeptide) pyrophosphoryl-undecaprenol N-acetylglucosamine transferase n=1 Tax=Texcoconibacillus texcoconensis TaxID=1095777 RepID=A0A840QLC8_9BACI|nr:undecaprenyldiphospho-muramoylpentapeptide beta-N-acetylglucosaminyltransferase [Texcoconibacillus texcoconensis]MBB5172172.1 UDP-N-acetylglucosamine--N-acetylmuramyl-(pentapeptide) pyrophosphoryl-undecaprenol N-acetylglucosamine transferase [Texcoconibacillus texcoconensis]